jgi:hypothetical protein
VSSLLPDLVPLENARIPSFGELRRIDPEFFRRGVAGSHRDEMSDELHKLFWAQPENATAMRRLGYDWAGLTGDTGPARPPSWRDEPPHRSEV